MGASLTALLGYDVTDPRSPHSVHVASEADVPAIDPWGHDCLHRAVRIADERDAVVVLDHGRERLYLAAPESLSYRPPGALGLGNPPALVVDDPSVLRPDGDDLAVEAFDPALLEEPAPVWPGTDGDPDPDAAPSEADSPADAVPSDDATADDPDGANETPADDREETPADDAAGTSPATPEDTPDDDTDDGPDDAGLDPVTDGGEPRDTERSGPPSVTVSPAFDVLVPAFDIEEQGEPAEPLPRHAVESPSGVGTGTPSG